METAATMSGDKPTASTTSTRSRAETVAEAKMRARSVKRMTEAVTPSSLACTRTAQGRGAPRPLTSGIG
jgi:hypothetical protein